MRGGYDIIFRIFLFILCAFFALYSVTVVITLYTIVLSSCVFCIIMFVGLQYYVCVATILCLWGYNIMFVGLQYYVCGATILCLWGYNIMFVGLQYYVQWFSFMLGSFVWCHHYVYDGDIIQLWKSRMKIANNKRTQIIFSVHLFR